MKTKHYIFYSFDDWRQCFTRKKSESEYIELNDNNENGEKDEPVGLLRLVSIFRMNTSRLTNLTLLQFQFANGFDWFMMCIATFFIIIHAGCILANLFLYGRLTGLFAIESYANNCNNLNKNSTLSMHNDNTLRQGRELHTFGNTQSYM